MDTYNSSRKVAHAALAYTVGVTWYIVSIIIRPDNKVHGANMGPIWGRQYFFLHNVTNLRLESRAKLLLKRKIIQFLTKHPFNPDTPMYVSKPRGYIFNVSTGWIEHIFIDCTYIFGKGGPVNATWKSLFMRIAVFSHDDSVLKRNTWPQEINYEMVRFHV